MINFYKLILPIITGAVFFIYFLGGHYIIDVNNIGWLANGDPAQHFIGWNFFRNTPLLQWPLGLNYPYGMDVSNSIVYTDSIPLIALLFKLINPLLPIDFQYTGLWLLLCFILQSVVSFILVYKNTQNYIFSLISSFLFCLSPILFERITGHFALSSHFLLLIGVYFYIYDKSIMKWALLICISALIHFYLTGMILLLYMGYVANNVFSAKNTKDKLIYFAKSVLYALLPLALVMYSIGYFTVQSGISGDGFGVFKTNLNSFFNPLYEYGSYFLSPLPHSDGDYEGYAYLGVGVLIICALALTIIAVKNESVLVGIKEKVTLFLLISIAIFSFSNSLYFGDKEILHIPLPEIIYNLLGIFRSSGRFVWVLYYFALYLSIIAIFKHLTLRVSYIIICTLTIVQYLDLSKNIAHINARYAENDDIAKGLDNMQMSTMLSKYDSLQAVLPPFFWNKWAQFGYVASKNKLSINFGYMARVDDKKKEKQLHNLYKTIDSGYLDKNSAYVFMDSGSLEYVIKRIKIDYTVKETSGYYFILPKQ